MEMLMRNSLQAYTKLKETGFSDDQARAIVESLDENNEIHLKDLATKADLSKVEAKLEARVEKVEQDIHWLTRLYMSGTLVILLGLALNFLHH